MPRRSAALAHCKVAVNGFDCLSLRASCCRLTLVSRACWLSRSNVRLVNAFRLHVATPFSNSILDQSCEMRSLHVVMIKIATCALFRIRKRTIDSAKQAIESQISASVCRKKTLLVTRSTLRSCSRCATAANKLPLPLRDATDNHETLWNLTPVSAKLSPGMSVALFCRTSTLSAFMISAASKPWNSVLFESEPD